MQTIFKIVVENKKKLLIVFGMIACMVIGTILIRNSYSASDVVEVDGLSFENLNIDNKDDTLHLTVDVKNTSGSEYKLDTITVKLTTDQGYVELPGYIGNILGENETKKLDIKYDSTLKVTDITYIINK